MGQGGDPRTAEDWAAVSQRLVAEADRVLKTGERLIAYERYGYAVEAAAKALILRRGKLEIWPRPGDAGAEDVFTHSFSRLMKFAGAFEDFCAARQHSPRLHDNWLVVKEWVPNRYSTKPPEHRDVVRLGRAVKEPVNGIIAWLNDQ